MSKLPRWVAVFEEEAKKPLAVIGLKRDDIKQAVHDYRLLQGHEALASEANDHIRDATKMVEQPDYRAVKTWHEGKPVYVAEQPCKTGSQCTSKCQQCEQPAQQPNEADELIRSLGFDPEQFRTEAGFINHMKLRAAIKHPEEYQAAMQPMYQKLTNCVFCGRLNPKEGVCDHGVEQPAQQQPDELTVWKARALQAEAVIAKFMEQPAQEPVAVAAQCKFDGETLWAGCSIEHHNLVKSEPEKWPQYQVRLLYTSPQPSKPEDK